MQPKTKTVAFILLSFVLGAVVGWYVERQYVGPEQKQFHHSQADLRRAFAERLKLDTTQSARVDSIIEYHRWKMNQYRQNIMAVRDTLRTEIRKLLNPVQNKLYDDYIREMNEREGKMRQSSSSKK